MTVEGGRAWSTGGWIGDEMQKTREGQALDGDEKNPLALSIEVLSSE